MFLFLISVIRFLFLSKLQDISRLTVKFTADGFKCAKAYCLCFTSLKDGKIGRGEVDTLSQLTKGDFVLCHYDIQINNDGHMLGIRW